MTACLGRRVAELADGRLSGDERERALAHVAGCASCRDALEVQRRIRDELASAPCPDPSDWLMASLRSVPDRTPRVDPAVLIRRSHRRRRNRAVAAGSSAAVVAVAVVGAMASIGQTAAVEPITGPHLSSFAAEHVSAVGQLPLGGPALAGDPGVSAPQPSAGAVVSAALPQAPGSTAGR